MFSKILLANRSIAQIDTDRMITTTSVNGGVVNNTYAASGNVLTATDAAGNTTTSTYNSFGWYANHCNLVVLLPISTIA